MTPANEAQSLLEVWDWYAFQRALVGEEKGRVFSLLAAGAAPTSPRYLAKTAEELEVQFEHQVAELNRLTMLGLFATTEAALRVDFVGRVKRKEKDDLSRRFRKAFKRRALDKIRLEEDILDTWRTVEAGAKIDRAVRDFKGAFRLRHWLAHGRYWRPKLGRAAGYGPVDVFDICRDLLEAVGLMPPDPVGL